MVVELTVPWETNMEWAFERKLARYGELKDQCEDQGWRCSVYPVEVGCRGFVGRSTVKFLCDVGMASRLRKTTVASSRRQLKRLPHGSGRRRRTNASCCRRPPGGPYLVLLGLPIHINFYWNRPQKEFQLRMVGDEQAVPVCEEQNETS